MGERSANELWQAALGQLQLQVTHANYETWLRDTTGLAFRDGVFVIAVPSNFVADWLSNRLQALIAKTLSRIIGEPVQLAFQVGTLDSAASHASGPPTLTEPLYPSARLSSLPKPRLNQRFTFDTFVVADCNRLAHAAALAASQHSDMPTHNPLFLYGDSGLGKTHLLHAVGHELLKPGLRVLFITAEQFTYEYVQAARQRHMDDFRAKFRSLDALLIDDIQFLAGKEGTQQEFFHTFNDLHSAGKQLVLTSDQPPQRLPHFSNRLRSRLQWGLIADLTPPPVETRLVILQARAENLHAQIDAPALEFLASQPYGNVRQLEGSLNRVLAYARLTQQPTTIDLAKAALLAPERPPQPDAPTPNAIIDAVCSHFHVSRQALRGKAREKRVTTARHVAMYLLRHDSCQPLAAIGHLLGDRDHSTVLYACRKIEREASILPQTNLDLAAVRERLQPFPAA